MFGQEMMSVTTLAQNLLKRSGRPRAGIWESRGERWARMAILGYTGS